MKIDTLIYHINKACDDCNFVDARTYIEREYSRLSTPVYQRQLNRNARDLLKFVIDSKNTDYTLTRQDLLILNSINKYATNFDVLGLKQTIKYHGVLLQNEEAIKMLSETAKGILSNMGAILGKKPEELELIATDESVNSL